jgi:ribosomal-protein-alanine N-acetyltransferase
MEKMPYQPESDRCLTGVVPMTLQLPASGVASDWRYALPVLKGEHVVLRELRASDARSLHALLTTEEVSRFISPPPTTVEGFERFIAWALRQRAAGSYACYAVTLHGFDTAIGLFQVRELERGFGTAEWGFALGSSFWGTGLFQESAELVLEFVFDTLGVHRLEARAAVMNKRQSLERNGEFLDQTLFSVLDFDWRESRRLMKIATVMN